MRLLGFLIHTLGFIRSLGHSLLGIRNFAQPSGVERKLKRKFSTVFPQPMQFDRFSDNPRLALGVSLTLVAELDIPHAF